jgi:hypothetical protein
MVLKVCHVMDLATCTNIINQEGFMSVEDLGILGTDSDVLDMAKRLVSRAQAEGKVYLGTVVAKRLPYC